MSKTQELIKLAELYKKGKTNEADKLLVKLINSEEKSGRYMVARSLKYLLSTTKNNSDEYFSLSGSIKDEENKLFELRKSEVRISDIILSQRNLDVLKEIIQNYNHRKLFIKNGVPLETKILLYGPPGTGKSLFAYVLAGELNIPIMHVYLDNLISAYLGDTGKNIRKVFDEAHKSQCILFLDEFDTIAKKRDDAYELGELKRVVTVLLQNIDALDSSNILVAATNHSHLLDSAIERRFTYHLNLDYLDRASTEDLLKLYLTNYKVKNIHTLSMIAANISGAILRDLVNRSLRVWLMNKEKGLLDDLLLQNIAEYRFQSQRIDTKNEDQLKLIIEVIWHLRESNTKLYTFKYLENLTGIPDSTIVNLFKKYKYI